VFGTTRLFHTYTIILVIIIFLFATQGLECVNSLEQPLYVVVFVKSQDKCLSYFIFVQALIQMLIKTEYSHECIIRFLDDDVTVSM